VLPALVRGSAQTAVDKMANLRRNGRHEHHSLILTPFRVYHLLIASTIPLAQYLVYMSGLTRPALSINSSVVPSYYSPPYHSKRDT